MNELPQVENNTGSAYERVYPTTTLLLRGQVNRSMDTSAPIVHSTRSGRRRTTFQQHLNLQNIQSLHDHLPHMAGKE